jgi:eukaryotic-like serine/threonine-protein kinase
MPLSSGEKLGPYEIHALIGAGGMGEVYRARDTKLKRDVALKILPEAFARDPGRLARFQREAEVLASLNHPNIAHIYGVAESENVRALIMELVEGESPKGPMPFDEARKIATQIAEALDYAHEKGVVHRDLKPANVKVTPEGVVKLLDFGLAKAFESTPDSAPSDPANSPTLTLGATVAGAILGTAAYMAPEQARGKRVDKRADIWAFGVVLYELLTGERPFRGEDVTEILASVVKENPDLGKAPAAIRRLLTRCLEKDPKKRLRDIGDVGDLLGPEEEAPVRQSSAAFVKIQWVAIALLLAIAAGLALTRSKLPPDASPTVRFRIPIAEVAGAPPPTVSPDGKQIVYANDGRLWVRAFDSLESRPLPDSDGFVAVNPFWSSDSRTIFFASASMLRKADANGGPAQALCALSDVLFGGFQLPDGRLVFAANQSGLLQVPAGGGTAFPLATGLPPGHLSLRGGNPLLPDGNHFLISSASGVYIGSVDGRDGPRKLLPDSATAAAYVLSAKDGGYLLFVRGGALMAQVFNPSKLVLSGEPLPVASNVGQFSASLNGVLVYRGKSGNQKLRWFDRQGNSSSTSMTEGEYTDLAISPDGSHVALVRGALLFSHDFRTEATMPVGRQARIKPVWSPDGKRILFEARGVSGGLAFQETAPDGGDMTEVLKSKANASPWDWSPDGRWLIYSVTDPQTREDLWLLPMQGEGKAEPFLVTGFSESDGAFSPDGRFVAYVSDESGEPEVYVRSFPASTGGKWRISVGGGYQPRWRRDGKELFYVQQEGRFMSADVATSPAFRTGTPKFLFQASIFGGGASTGNHYWDVAKDGRFLVNTVENGAASSEVTVVLNWLAGLKK